jgi:predicted TIM-barrel fold metal-dependent hydrolase
MFETDFPHRTSLSPGQGSSSPRPDELIADHIKTLGADIMHKMLYENAARVYHIKD